jgi:hypothetical protein
MAVKFYCDECGLDNEVGTLSLKLATSVTIRGYPSETFISELQFLGSDGGVGVRIKATEKAPSTIGVEESAEAESSRDLCSSCRRAKVEMLMKFVHDFGLD